MSRYFLTKLRVEGFRGINNENQPLELSFKPNSVNSVFAANASGKSSIFEALCFAIRGHVPKLRAMQASERPDRYLANLFHSSGRAVVGLELEDEAGGKHAIEVVRDSNGQRVVSSRSGLPDPASVLASLDEDFTLLDYEQFLSFINQTPLERGRTFAALLGLSGYSQLRQLLQSLSDTRNLNADFDLPSLRTSAEGAERNANEALARFRTAYANLKGSAPDDSTYVTKWASDVREVLASIPLFRDVIGDTKLSEIDIEALRAIVRNAEGGAKRDDLAKFVEAVVRLRAVKVTSDAMAATEAGSLKDAIRTRLKLLAGTPGENYQRLHEAGLELYKSDEWHDPSRCALCSSNLGEPLLSKIEAEVARFEAVRAQGEVIQTLAEAEWIQCLARLESISELDVPPGEMIGARVREDAQKGALDEKLVDQAHSRFALLSAKLRTVLQGSEARRSALEQELPPSLVVVTTQLENASLARDGLATYWRQTNAYKETRAKLSRYERWQKYITAVTDEICAAEAHHASARLAALGGDYKELFRNIMGVADVVPALSRAPGSEQLDVQLEDFHGMQGLSARALLSESYRNALAVSVFLSAASQQVTAARFVVLDDVTSSFDAGHQWRLMDEIRVRLQHRAGSDGLQFILLSHDGLLEKYFDKVASSGGWHHQRLQGWPPLGAVSVVGQDADRLRVTAVDFLRAGQVKDAEPLIRQYMEFALVRVIRKLNIPVPFDFSIRDQLQMVGNCLDAITAAVRLQGAAGGLILTPTQVADLDRSHVPALVGNWVSHYATAVGANLSPAVLLGVLQSVDDLSGCFKYQDTTVSPSVERWYRSLTSK